MVFSSQSSPVSDSERRRLFGWRMLTLFTLTAGYGAYYFCRSNLSVASPLLLEEFGDQDFNKESLGLIASAGLAFYVLGKFVNGVVSDFLGGRVMFLGAMIASGAITVVFGLSGGIVSFVVLWSLNRLVQSGGWPALIKTTSRWFPHKWYGAAVGILSLSFLVGDAVARLFFGGLLESGFGWRDLFFAAAAVIFAVALFGALALKDSPEKVGLPEDEASPDNVYGEAGNDARPAGVLELIRPYLGSLAFWMVCVMSFGLTFIRETFNFWTPTLLGEITGASDAMSGIGSVVFPAIGAVSVLLSGFLSDWLAKGNRAKIILPGLILATVSIFALSYYGAAAPYWLAVTLIGCVSFFLIGPYSFLGGAIALDLGGKRGSSTASGVIDGVGYGGAILSGWGVGFLAESSGWGAVFGALAAAAFASALAAAVYWQRISAKQRA